MAIFRFYAITANNAVPGGPYTIRDFDPNSPIAATTPDRTFENGDDIAFTPHGGGSASPYEFHGYEDGTGYAILKREGSNEYVILFGDDRPPGGNQYSPSGTIITTTPLRIGEPVSYIDYGYRRTTGDTDEFGSEDREVEFDHGTYAVGSTVEIRVLTRDGAGDISSIDQRISARFDGYDRETGYPVFTDTSDNRQLILASAKQNTYDVPPADIITTGSLRTGDATFTNYAVKFNSGIGDGEFFIAAREVTFAHGLYEEGDSVTLDIDGLAIPTTLFGHESDTGNPIFWDANLNRLIVLVNSNAPLDSTYMVDNVVTNTPYITCFAPDTLIATPDGESAVETLKPGDRVLTADGGTVSVRFVGFQKVPTMFGAREVTHPVRIRAGALGRNTPHTDLVVTKDHGMIVDGVICHAGALINGTSITEVPTAELGRVATYYHVETEGHVPLLANGAVAESFIDEVDRARFANHGEFVAMYGARVPDMTPMNLPRAMSARQVPQGIRARLGLPEHDVTFIPAPAPSGLRRLWQELRDQVRSAGYRLVRGLARGRRAVLRG